MIFVPTQEQVDANQDIDIPDIEPREVDGPLEVFYVASLNYWQVLVGGFPVRAETVRITE